MLVATGRDDGLVQVWNTAGDLVQEFKGHKGHVYGAVWNKYVAFC